MKVLNYFVLLLLTCCFYGCVSDVSVAGSPCPCPNGYMCCEATDQCIPEEDACDDWGIIIDDMSRIGINLNEGNWMVDSDIWSRVGIDALYPDMVAAYEGATKVWDITETVNMAPNQSTTQFMEEGYVNLENQIGNTWDAIVQVIGPIDPFAESPLAYAGVVMEFLPRKYDGCTDDCWMPENTGISIDLSSREKLVIGLKCDKGFQLSIWVSSLAEYSTQYGKYVECEGDYRDYELILDDIRPLHGGEGDFDLTDAFRFAVGFANDGTPEKFSLSIAGVALDTSVLAHRNL